MLNNVAAVGEMSGEALIARLYELRVEERRLLVEFLTYLAELDRRRLYVAAGFSSLWTFCTDDLGLTKSQTFRRTTAARLLARFPVVGEHLADGRLCLTTLVELRDVLDEARLDEILGRASGRTEDQVKELVAARRPWPAPADLFRRVPERRAGTAPIRGYVPARAERRAGTAPACGYSPARTAAGTAGADHGRAPRASRHRRARLRRRSAGRSRRAQPPDPQRTPGGDPAPLPARDPSGPCTHTLSLCFRSEIDSRDLDLVLEMDRELEVDTDRQFLMSAVSNLVQNALKYTHMGGHVSVRGHCTDNRLVIEVEDECGGLPPGKVDELFRPFVRGAHQTPGVGLGLSIAMRAIKAINGEIRVRDLPGKGCIFLVDLPAVLSRPAKLL